MIFTSPSSARGNLDAEDIPEAQGTQGKRRKTPPSQPPVAAQLKMDGQVTARAIAYTAVQVSHSSMLQCSRSPVQIENFSGAEPNFENTLLFIAHPFIQASLCPQ